MAEYGTFVDGVSLKASELNNFLVATSFTPVIRQSIAITLSSSRARYFKVNKTVFCLVEAAFSSGGGPNNEVLFDLPVTAKSNSMRIIGQGRYFDSGAADPFFLLRAVQFSTTRVAFLKDTSTSLTGYLGLTAGGAAITIANGDSMALSIVYEAA